jgi:hypothetical protein
MLRDFLCANKFIFSLIYKIILRGLKGFSKRKIRFFEEENQVCTYIQTMKKKIKAYGLQLYLYTTLYYWPWNQCQISEGFKVRFIIKRQIKD